MQTKIQNTEPTGATQVKSPEMNDRDRLNDVLATEKYLATSLNTAVWEASHDQLHKTFLTILNETHQGARDIFNMMFQRGEYKLNAEQQQKLDQTKQQFEGYLSQLPYPNQTH